MLVHRLERGSAFLWTLPLFHCNGWCFPWAVTGAGGAHVMLRALDPARILELLVRERVTHFNGAPTVLLMLAEAPQAKGLRFDPRIRVATGGSPPSPTLLAAHGRDGHLGHASLWADGDLRPPRHLRDAARLGAPRRRRARGA